MWRWQVCTLQHKQQWIHTMHCMNGVLCLTEVKIWWFFFLNPFFSKRVFVSTFVFFHFGEFLPQSKNIVLVLFIKLNFFWSNNKTQHEIVKFFLVAYLKICIEITSKIKCFLTLVKVQKKQVDFECKLIKQLNAHLIISTCLKPLMKIFIFYLEYFMDNFNMINHFEHLFQSLEMKKKSMNIMFFFSFFLR
jgi:hypothetical protein